MNMNDIIQNKPFEDVDSEYMTINDVLGRDIQILDFKPFENDKGEGVFILCKDVETDCVFHLCTHRRGFNMR